MTNEMLELADRIDTCIRKRIYDVGLSQDEKTAIVTALRAQSDVRAPAAPADLAEDCAKIAEGHVGASSEIGYVYAKAYDEACRDIAKAIRDTHIVEGAGK